MRFLKEPDFTHGKISKTAVVLVNLGTPDAATPSAVKRYLKQFLWDRRVVEVPRAIWWAILHGIILPFRSRASAAKYATIWESDGSPLKIHTAKQAKLLQGYLGERGHDVVVKYAMRYGSPSIPEVLQELKKEFADQILILPAYPQYSATTTASNMDAVFQHYQEVRNVPELRFIKHYHDHEAYIEALKHSVQEHWNANGRGEVLLMSFHGLPKEFLMRGDPYHCECLKTARLLAHALGMKENEYRVSFQSRLGKAEWLKPYTSETVKQLAREGIKKLDVICPGFIADCLETLEEIKVEVKQEFIDAGGDRFEYIPCLNESPNWMRALAEITEQHLIGWPTMNPPSVRELLKQASLETRQRAKQAGAEH